MLLLERKPAKQLDLLPAPDATQPVFCQGWYGDTGNGRYMSETHAPLWVHGRKRMHFDSFNVQPKVHMRKGPDSWKLVTVDVGQLVHVPGQGRRVGAKLLGIEPVR